MTATSAYKTCSSRSSRASLLAAVGHWPVAQAERAHPRHIGTRPGLTPTSAPGRGSPRPHRHRHWARPSPICTGLGLPFLGRLSRYNLRWRRTRNDSRGSPASMCIATSSVSVSVSASSGTAAPLLRPLLPRPSSPSVLPCAQQCLSAPRTIVGPRASAASPKVGLRRPRARRAEPYLDAGLSVACRPQRARARREAALAPRDAAVHP